MQIEYVEQAGNEVCTHICEERRALMRVWVWTVVWQGTDFHLQGRWLVISFALMAAW